MSHHGKRKKIEQREKSEPSEDFQDSKGYGAAHTQVDSPANLLAMTNEDEVFRLAARQLMSAIQRKGCPYPKQMQRWIKEMFEDIAKEKTGIVSDKDIFVSLGFTQGVAYALNHVSNVVKNEQNK